MKKKQIIKFYFKDNLSVREISHRVNTSRTYIYDVLRRYRQNKGISTTTKESHSERIKLKRQEKINFFASQIIDLNINQELTIKEICQKIPLTYLEISQVIKTERKNRNLPSWQEINNKKLRVRRKSNDTGTLGTYGQKATRPNSSLFSKETQKDILKLKKDGLMSFQIARKLNVSRSDVLCCLQMMN